MISAAASMQRLRLYFVHTHCYTACCELHNAICCKLSNTIYASMNNVTQRKRPKVVNCTTYTISFKLRNIRNILQPGPSSLQQLFFVT